MKILSILLEPRPIINDAFFHTLLKEDDFRFNCDDCGNEIKITAQDQISGSWIGKPDAISELDFKFLKKHYNIGLNNKSQDGGLPVFDMMICPRCESKFISYCGVKETSNSVYSVSIIGLFKTESKKPFLPKSDK
jgi:transcription elongation factor Elf1